MKTCKVCGKGRKPGEIYFHRDKYPIKLQNGKKVYKTEICMYCLYDHMEKHYPGSPNHKHLAHRLGKEVDVGKQMNLFEE